jgi:transketolase
MIGMAPVKVAIDAGVRLGWDRFIGTDGVFIGMHGYGASGTIEQLYPHFGITAEATVKAVEERLRG